MKTRLDIRLVNNHGIDSRTKAQSFIMQGLVYVNGLKVDKPGFAVSIDDQIELKIPEIQFVSRGGFKLHQAITEFSISVKDKIGMDVGASTGGFTDCLLQNGAKKVYAIDVGYGQFDYKLRNDSRVVVMEKCNFRYLDKLDEKIDLIVCDVSFISIKKIIPRFVDFLVQKGEVVALIKPQFEVTPKEVKKGVVRDVKLHERVISEVKDCFIENNYSIKGLVESPILGPKGNKEFLIWASVIPSAEGASGISL